MKHTANTVAAEVEALRTIVNELRTQVETLTAKCVSNNVAHNERTKQLRDEVVAQRAQLEALKPKEPRDQNGYTHDEWRDAERALREELGIVGYQPDPAYRKKVDARCVEMFGPRAKH